MSHPLWGLDDEPVTQACEGAQDVALDYAECVVLATVFFALGLIVGVLAQFWGVRVHSPVAVPPLDTFSDAWNDTLDEDATSQASCQSLEENKASQDDAQLPGTHVQTPVATVHECDTPASPTFCTALQDERATSTYTAVVQPRRDVLPDLMLQAGGEHDPQHIKRLLDAPRLSDGESEQLLRCSNDLFDLHVQLVCKGESAGTCSAAEKYAQRMYQHSKQAKTQKALDHQAEERISQDASLQIKQANRLDRVKNENESRLAVRCSLPSSLQALQPGM